MDQVGKEGRREEPSQSSITAIQAKDVCGVTKGSNGRDYKEQLVLDIRADDGLDVESERRCQDESKVFGLNKKKDFQ